VGPPGGSNSRPRGITWIVVRVRPLSGRFVERAEVSTALAFRVAKLLDVSLHHVLSGEALPPGTCRHCGRAQED